MDRNHESGLWVFGYGSLCWHPGFEFNRKLTGHVKGYARRFWQGNATHRGTEEKPGRVATLIEDSDSVTWGCAYEVRGETAMSYLDTRECHLGGYLTKFATFYPREESTDGSEAEMAPFPAILYIATSKSRHWLGDAPLPDIANQITTCSGPSGHNAEYLLRLATFMREKAPDVIDDHLFGLEHLVKEQIITRKLCIKTLLGEYVAKPLTDENQNDALQNDLPENALRTDSFQFTSRVPDKKLRCLNM